MPIDPRIPLGGTSAPQQQTLINPLDAYGKMLTLRALMGQERMQDIAARKAERDFDTEDALRRSIVIGADGKIDRAATLQRVSRVAPDAALKLPHQWAIDDIAQGKLTVEAEKARLEKIQKVIDLQGNVARSVIDAEDKETAWQRGRQFMAQSGLVDAQQLAQLPANYDAGLVNQMRHRAESAGETVARQTAAFNQRYPTPESKEAANLQAEQLQEAEQGDKQQATQRNAEFAKQEEQDKFIQGGGVLTQPYTGTSGESFLQFEEPPQELSGEGGGVSGVEGLTQPMATQPTLGQFAGGQPVGERPTTFAGDTVQTPSIDVTATRPRNPLALARWTHILGGKIPEGLEIDERTGYLKPMSEENLAAIRSVKKAGASSTTIGLQSYEKELNKLDAKAVSEARSKAESLTSAASEMRVINDILKGYSGGPWAQIQAEIGRFLPGSDMAKLSSVQDLARSIQVRLAPMLRIPGSGATTDFEMKLYMQSIPGLANTEAGRDFMTRMGEKAAERAGIAADIKDELTRGGEYSVQSFQRELNKRAGKNIFTPEEIEIMRRRRL